MVVDLFSGTFRENYIKEAKSIQIYHAFRSVGISFIESHASARKWVMTSMSLSFFSKYHVNVPYNCILVHVCFTCVCISLILTSIYRQYIPHRFCHHTRLEYLSTESLTESSERREQ